MANGTRSGVIGKWWSLPVKDRLIDILMVVSWLLFGVFLGTTGVSVFAITAAGFLATGVILKIHSA